MINRRPNRGVTTPAQRAQMKWRRDIEETPAQYERRLERNKASKARRRLEDLRGETLSAARRSADRRKIEFGLKETDLEWPTHCPVLGIKLHYPGRSRADPAGAAFDRINNELGYLPGNVIIVSHWVNSRKGDATPAQLRAIADFYSKFDTVRGDVAPPRPIHGRCEACLEHGGAERLHLAYDYTGRAGWVCDDCTNLGTFEWKRSRINDRFRLPPKSKQSIKT